MLTTHRDTSQITMRISLFARAAMVVCGSLLLLAGCGGGGGGSAVTAPAQTPSPTPTPTPTPTPAAFSIGGSIAGLDNSTGLTLVNGSEVLAVAANATSFTFASTATEGASFNVTVGEQPVGKLGCTVSNPQGTVTQSTLRTVAVNCAPRPFAGLYKGSYTVSTMPWEFKELVGIGADNSGNLYVADKGDRTVRKIAPSGAITLLAGGGEAGRVDATGAAARFQDLLSLAADKTGNVYVVDNTPGAAEVYIRKISPAGVVTTLTKFNESIAGLAADNAGALYFVVGHKVLKMSPAGVLSTFAGSDMSGFADGQGAQAGFYFPQGLAVDASGNVYVADLQASRLRRISAQGLVTTVDSLYLDPGRGMGGPFHVAADRDGNVYATEYAVSGSVRFNNLDQWAYVRGVDSTGSSFGLTGFNKFGNTDGPADGARFGKLSGITVDGAGYIYLADAGNKRVRKISP